MAAKSPHANLPPKDHLAAIGAIAVVWTVIESSLELAILGLYELDLGRGLVLTNNLTFQARMSLLRILTDGGAIPDPKLRQEMADILPRIEKGFGDRNAMIHGSWGRAEKPGYARRSILRARGKKLRAEMVDFSAADLWAVVASLRLVLGDFAALAKRLGLDERSASAPKHSTARM